MQLYKYWIKNTCRVLSAILKFITLNYQEITMKIKLSLILLLTILELSKVNGQENKVKIGLGVSINPFALFYTSSTSDFFVPVDITNIYIPVMVKPNFRIEPEAGIFSHSYEYTSGTNISKHTLTVFRIGIGLFYMHSIDTSFSTYLGPRTGILSTSEKSGYTSSYSGDEENTFSEIDFFIGLCLGGEYLFSRHFSAGGEVQLNYIKYGNPERTPASITSTNYTQSIFTNNCLLFIRWYF